jgi:hypothetical protein
MWQCGIGGQQMGHLRHDRTEVIHLYLIYRRGIIYNSEIKYIYFLQSIYD